jgi:hypothetical protein
MGCSYQILVISPNSIRLSFIGGSGNCLNKGHPPFKLTKKGEVAQRKEKVEKSESKVATKNEVLKHPKLPLRNSASQLWARRWVHKREVSFGSHTYDVVHA